MNTDSKETDQKTGTLVEEVVNGLGGVHLYKDSIHEDDHGNVLFMVKEGTEKSLVVLPGSEGGYTGESVKAGGHELLRCNLTHENAEVLRSNFDFTNAVLIGKVDSYGFGDRLGNAGPAHLRAVKQSHFKPVMAQQSIRELERTNRTAEEVMDAASFSVFQEGYHDGFGADGDHLKTTDDIDRMVKAGYTMFTIDPSDYVENNVKNLGEAELRTAYKELPWDDLETTADMLAKRFLETDVELHDGYRLETTEDEVLQGMVKYGRVITHAKMMANYLKETYPDHPAELELSVDETDEPTTLFEHYLVASELDRLGVDLVSLAPRFCGDFEKGIDFKGDLDQFRAEYVQHLTIADRFGGYKLSVHSGSDKFSVYKVVGSIDLGTVHVKTAGTSYLEALRTIAVTEPELFREILSFSIDRFQEDKKTYHISADLDEIPDPDSIDAADLPDLLNDNHARQVLHVAYGSVLSGSLPEASTFKERLMTSLEENEDLHYENLMKHFDKHLSPFS